MCKISNIKRYNTIIAILFILGLISCDDFHHYSHSYVQSYTLYDNISVRRSLASSSTKNLDLSVATSHSIGLLSEGQDRNLFDRICVEYGDTSYNKMVYLPNNYPTIISVYPHITTINVISNKDFDVEHPAGTSLNDIMNITFSSCIEYVESNYDENQKYSNSKKEKLLKDLAQDDLRMLTDCIVLSFNKEPDVVDIHTLTIICTNSHNENFTTDINYDFRLPEGYIGNYDNLITNGMSK